MSRAMLISSNSKAQNCKVRSLPAFKAYQRDKSRCIALFQLRHPGAIKIACNAAWKAKKRTRRLSMERVDATSSWPREGKSEGMGPWPDCMAKIGSARRFATRDPAPTTEARVVAPPTARTMSRAMTYPRGFGANPKAHLTKAFGEANRRSTFRRTTNDERATEPRFLPGG